MPIDEPIDVDVVDGRPVAFEWENQVYQIFDVLHTWKSERSAWWKLSKHGQRHHFRVHAGWERHRITAEIVRSTTAKGERWILSDLYD